MSKCYKCAELRNCFAGLHGEGKAKCRCFCPVFAETNSKRLILEKADDYALLIDGLTNSVLASGHSLDVEEVLTALEIDFIVIEKK